jgi:hypothetical protein
MLFWLYVNCNKIEITDHLVSNILHPWVAIVHQRLYVSPLVKIEEYRILIFLCVESTPYAYAKAKKFFPISNQFLSRFRWKGDKNNDISVYTLGVKEFFKTNWAKFWDSSPEPAIALNYLAPISLYRKNLLSRKRSARFCCRLVNLVRHEIAVTYAVSCITHCVMNKYLWNTAT